MSDIVIIGGVKKKDITTETSRGVAIKNERECILENNPFVKYSIQTLLQKFPDAAIRNNPSGNYNCHGLTFASRRTGIFEPAELEKIIEHDQYKRVDTKDVLPGDIILYCSDKGDIEHSGLVVKSPDRLLNVPFVLSKWGMVFEVVHNAYLCPYDVGHVKFYRCYL